MALKRMGFASELVAHGLRSIGSTTLNEMNFNRDWIEAALSHCDKDKIRAAYNRTVYLDQRREMMEQWSQHIENANQENLLSFTGKYTNAVGE